MEAIHRGRSMGLEEFSMQTVITMMGSLAKTIWKDKDSTTLKKRIRIFWHNSKEMNMVK